MAQCSEFSNWAATDISRGHSWHRWHFSSSYDCTARSFSYCLMSCCYRLAFALAAFHCRKVFGQILHCAQALGCRGAEIQVSLDLNRVECRSPSTSSCCSRFASASRGSSFFLEASGWSLPGTFSNVGCCSWSLKALHQLNRTQMESWCSFLET